MHFLHQPATIHLTATAEQITCISLHLAASRCISLHLAVPIQHCVVHTILTDLQGSDSTRAPGDFAMRCNRLFGSFFVWLAIVALPVAADAGGTISDPQNGSLEAGTAIQPSGDLDAIHAENGDTITCKIFFRKSTEMSFPMDPAYTLNCNYDWTTPSQYTVPGGDYIGGGWKVQLLINGNVVAGIEGNIVAPG
jgi:hypothetical protein